MPLSANNMFPGGPVKSADAIEYFNLLTGAMTDQPVTLANTLTAGGSHGVGSVPFRVNGVAAQTANMHEIRALATDVNPIFAIGPDGTLKWGPGGGVATDTTLSRSSPGALRVSGLSIANYNLLVNPGFEIWQRGNGPFSVNGAFTADRWALSLAGTDTLSVSKDTVNVDTGSGAAAACTFTLGTGAGGTNYYQFAARPGDGVEQFRGKTVIFACRVKTSTANAVRLKIGDQAAVVATGSFHTGDGTWQTLTVSYAVPNTNSTLSTRVHFEASCTAYVDNATFAIGSAALDYSPLTPADDLARCLRYYQRWQMGASGPLAMLQAFAATAADGVLAMQARMGGTPGFTVSSLADWQLLNAAGTGIALSNMSLMSTSSPGHAAVTAGVASGLVAGNAVCLWAASASAWLALEWNP